MVELRGCAHCGADAALVPHSVGAAVRYYVQCEHCGIKTVHHHYEAGAVENWNTRPPTDEALRIAVEALERISVVRGQWVASRATDALANIKELGK